MSADALWSRAQRVIPGGNGLLSKRPQRYCHDWPTYFSSAKGVHVWDTNNVRYTDMAQMAIGSAILGYCDADVDRCVHDAIDHCVATTLNSQLEVELAELLVATNPSMDCVRFTRGGGEAMALAVRIARAATGRSCVLFSGYHGWHDWYIAANIAASDSLDGHLLPGLEPAGVPRCLGGTAIPFTYNDVDSLTSAVLSLREKPAAIIIEGARYERPTDEFIKCVMMTAHRLGAVVIFDEITSGYRMRCGGLYPLVCAEHPDIIVLGKALGNGYAIAAVVGKHDMMRYASITFNSSTFWTESIGFAAGLATLRKLSNTNFGHIESFGASVASVWNELAHKHGLALMTTSFLPLVTFKLQYDASTNNALYALFASTMLTHAYLASNSVYVSFAHNDQMIDEYANAVDHAFHAMRMLRDELAHGDIDSFIDRRDDGFARLT